MKRDTHKIGADKYYLRTKHRKDWGEGFHGYCLCGWFGPPEKTMDEAWKDANGHLQQVAPNTMFTLPAAMKKGR